MRFIKAVALLASLLGVPVAHANVVITDVSLTPNPIGVNDSTTITVKGFVNTVPAGQANCTGLEIFFGDIVTYASTDPYKPAASFVRFQPGSSASFPISVTHQYGAAQTFDVIASPVKLFNGKWYTCSSNSTLATLTVLGDTIQSVKSITPAVINQQTSVIVKGLGSCSQNVQLNWGDGNTSTIAGPVDLKLGGVASHTYASSGAKTVTASGSTCAGTATTTVSVGLLSKPGRVVDNVALQNLRERLDRFAQLPPPPMPGGDPRCPICDGLAKQVSILDQTGHELQTQSGAVLKDLGAELGKKAKPINAPVAGELVGQLDGYFALRTQLLKLYGQAQKQSQSTKAK